MAFDGHRILAVVVVLWICTGCTLGHDEIRTVYVGTGPESQSTLSDSNLENGADASGLNGMDATGTRAGTEEGSEVESNLMADAPHGADFDPHVAGHHGAGGVEPGPVAGEPRGGSGNAPEGATGAIEAVAVSMADGFEPEDENESSEGQGQEFDTNGFDAAGSDNPNGDTTPGIGDPNNAGFEGSDDLTGTAQFAGTESAGQSNNPPFGPREDESSAGGASRFEADVEPTAQGAANVGGDGISVSNADESVGEPSPFGGREENGDFAGGAAAGQETSQDNTSAFEGSEAVSGSPDSGSSGNVDNPNETASQGGGDANGLGNNDDVDASSESQQLNTNDMGVDDVGRVDASRDLPLDCPLLDEGQVALDGRSPAVGDSALDYGWQVIQGPLEAIYSEEGSLHGDLGLELRVDGTESRVGLIQAREPHLISLGYLSIRMRMADAHQGDDGQWDGGLGFALLDGTVNDHERALVIRRMPRSTTWSAWVNVGGDTSDFFGNELSGAFDLGAVTCDDPWPADGTALWRRAELFLRQGLLVFRLSDDRTSCELALASPFDEGVLWQNLALFVVADSSVQATTAYFDRVGVCTSAP